MNQPTLLAIADISGYTLYMAETKMELEHGQRILNALVQSIIRQAAPPFEIAKLEGDAVFMFAPANQEEPGWPERRKDLWARLKSIFHAFYEGVEKISTESAVANCFCNACRGVKKLRLKMVVHLGEAHFFEVGGFRELSGIDVILVHLLLKNSVPADHYLLLTEPAFQALAEPEGVAVEPGEETYPAIGAVKTYIHYPESHPALVLDLNLLS